MTYNWREVAVDDVCEVFDGPHATPPKCNEGPIFLGISSLDKGRIDISKSDHISEIDFSAWTRRVTPAEGDVVFSYETRLGEAGIIPKGIRCCLGRRMALMRVKDRANLYPPFLLYSYLGPSFQQTIAERTILGSTVERIPLTDFPNFPLSLPPLAEQKAIAHILGTLDDKIELNRKTNDTLEAIAKALFKSWFVDFDPVRAKAEGRPTGLPAEISDLFPDSFEDSELGEIPRGWETGSFLNLVNVISGGTPSTRIASYWNGSISWFSVVDAPDNSNCWVIGTEKTITQDGLDNCSARLLRVGATIITARGTVGKVCLVGTEMAMNQSCYALETTFEQGDFFTFYLTKSIVDLLQARSHGSVFNTITKDTLAGVVTVSPPSRLVESFEQIAESCMFQLRKHLVQTEILSSIRDTLLPKLISSELRVPDAEALVAEAGL